LAAVNDDIKGKEIDINQSSIRPFNQPRQY
jgi:hypothetical protein